MSDEIVVVVDGVAIKRGHVYAAEIRHDNWCPKLWRISPGECCCNQETTFKEITK